MALLACLASINEAGTSIYIPTSKSSISVDVLYSVMQSVEVICHACITGYNHAWFQNIFVLGSYDGKYLIS